MTPEMVLKASGHVDRFTDFMVTDIVTHDCHRADHLLKAALEAVKADDKQTPEKKDVRLPCPSLQGSCQTMHPYGACTYVMCVRAASAVSLQCTMTCSQKMAAQAGEHC